MHVTRFSPTKTDIPHTETRDLAGRLPPGEEEVHTSTINLRSKLRSFIWARSLVQTHLPRPTEGGGITVFVPMIHGFTRCRAAFPGL